MKRALIQICTALTLSVAATAALAGTAVTIKKFSIADAPLTRLYPEKPIELGDVIDRTSESTMTVGYGRYKSGESNEWTVTYDEALIITRGKFTVVNDGTEYTALPGEVIYLKNGTKVLYRADDDVELVYVTHPHWRQ